MSFTPVTLLVGIVLIIGALGLFFLDKIRPGYARDSDKIYAVLLLISGFLSLGHLTAGVTESFQLMLMGGMLFTLVLESIRNREPIVMEPPNRMPPRPPQRPRYDDRPPRRVYRAELDEREARMDRPYAPRMNPARDPRMNPARNEYRPNEYDMVNRPRQPYEEYRGPAGSLRPSEGIPNGGGRYGERPPARPPMNGNEMNNGPMNGQRNGAADNFQGRPDDEYGPGSRGANRPVGADMPPPPGPVGHSGNGNPNGRERPDGRPGNRTDSRPDDRAGGRTGRSLDVRPYSEAPKIDLSRDDSQGNREGSPDDGYRSAGRPEGAPSES